MDLSPYITQLREDLTAAAAAGDEHTRRTAIVLSSALEPAVRLALMQALSDLAAEVTTHLDDQVVDVRLDGRDVRIAVSGGSHEPAPEPDQQPPTPPLGEGGDISRITLRMLEEIKSQAEQAASTQGVSLNTWVAQAVQGALRARTRPWDSARQSADHADTESRGSRVRGWVQG